MGLCLMSKNRTEVFEIVKGYEFQPYDQNKIKVEKTEVLLIKNKKLLEVDSSFFWNYDFFPQSIMDKEPEWVRENRSLKNGDVILQLIKIIPIKYSPIMFYTGVKIIDWSKELDQISFKYATLYSHPEKGIAEFKMYERDGDIFLCISTWSYPNLPKIVCFISPLIRIYQRYCTLKSIKHFKNLYKMNA